MSINENYFRKLFAPTVRRQRRLNEQLEDRVLFDAVTDLAPEMFDPSLSDPFVPTVDTQAEHGVNAATAAEQSPIHAAREIVFVDKSVAGYELLVADLVVTHQADVVFLDADGDGLSQIAERMQGRTGITAVHIISHGDLAELSLGTATLTAESIRGEHADEVATIGGALADNADLLIYGCRFGEGADGQAAAQRLADATGADVAASDDLTGNAALGGDWDLELRIGSIEATVLRADNFASVLSVEATESIVTVQDANASNAGAVTLSPNGDPLAVTTSGTPVRVGQMLERIWQYGETGDVGAATYVFDISGLGDIAGTRTSEFGLIVSNASDLSGASTETLVASGFDAANKLIYFHGVDLDSGDYFALATNVVTDNFSVFPTASGPEDSAIDLGLSLNATLTDGGTLRDIIGTAIGYRASNATNTATEFLIPAGTTGIKITGYSTLDTGTTALDDHNDDYQSMNVSIDLDDETSGGFVAYLIDQGPSRSDQFGWSDAPLGTAVLSGGATVTGDANSGINPIFSIVDGRLQIVENHNLQTAYHVEFLTNATSSADFIQTASAVREDGDQANVSLAIPANADFLVLNIADAATSSNSRVEYKGNSRIYVDLATLTASGTVAAERGETDNRVITYAFENYDVSSSTVGSVLSSSATKVGDTQQTANLPNDSKIYVDGSGNLVIERNDTFADNFNSLVTVEYYDRKDVGSSAALLGESTDYGEWNSDPSDPVSTLEFDIPANATLGILNLSMNGTRPNDTNENMGAGFAVIDLTTGKSSGTMYMVRTFNIVDFVAWDNTDFGTVFFEDPNSNSNHTSIDQFKDEFPANAEFKLNATGDKLILETHSSAGTQTFLDYFAAGQVQWYGAAPFELEGFPTDGTFNTGSLNPETGNWNLTIEEALTDGLFFVPEEHASGNQSIDVTIRIGHEMETTVVRVEAVIDPVSFDASDASGDEDTNIAISANVTPTFVDQDGSETVTAVALRNVTIGHTVSDGINSFTASAGNQDLDVTGWDRTALTYRALPDETGTFSVDMDVAWQDVGGGVTDTDSTTTTFDVIVQPLNDQPVAVDDSYLTLEDEAVLVLAADGVLRNDSDPDGDSLLVNTLPVSGPGNGMLSLNANGSFTYTPNTGFIGNDSFEYRINDENGGTTTATAYIKVSPKVTGPLTANDDTATTDEEMPVNIDVQGNDDLPFTGSFSITSTTDPTNGSVTVRPDGTIDYAPDGNFFGTDTFDYTLTDANGRVSSAIVTVTVSNTQDPPTATADSGSTPEDTILEDLPVLVNDADPDGDMLTVTMAAAQNGTVVINANGTLDYTPNSNFNGIDTITYEISDGNGGEATSTVMINVVPMADPPTSADHTVTVVEDSEYVFTDSDFAFADGDPDDSLTLVRIDTLANEGELSLAGVAVTAGQVISTTDINSGRLAFRPDPDGFGNGYATFNFSVGDGALFQATPNTMTVDVTNLPDPPTATGGSMTVAEESIATPLGLTAPSDPDGDVLTVTITALPTMGTVTLSDGTPIHNGQTLTVAELTALQYDAPADSFGASVGSLSYTVSDGAQSDSGSVDITVTAVNDRPVVDLNGPTVPGLPGKVTIDDRTVFAASLTGHRASSIIDDGGAFAADQPTGSVAVVNRSGSVAGEAFAYSIYNIDYSNTPTGMLTPGVIGADLAGLDDILVETPAAQGSAVGNGSWGVDSGDGAGSTRNGLLFDFTTTPGDLGIGHFAAEFHDLKNNPAFTAAEYRIYNDGILVDSGTIDWGAGNDGDNESHFFGYAVCSEADHFDQILIVVGDSGAGGGTDERLAADRFTFGTSFVYDADVDYADTFTEGSAAVSIVAPIVTVHDDDDTTLPALTIDVDESTIVDSGSEFLVIGGTSIALDAVGDSTTQISLGGIDYDVTFIAATASLTIVRNDAAEMTTAEIQAILADTSYANTSVLPTESDRIFSVSTTDGDSSSNTAVSNISVVRSAESAVWSLGGTTDVIDGNPASYEVSLSAALRNGETAFVDLCLLHVDTDSSDIADFSANVQTAVDTYSGPGVLTWIAGTLTFTSDGTGSMSPLTISVATVSDGVYEGDEDFKVLLTNPGTSTGEVITMDLSASEVTTTIEDNDSPITISIGDGSATEGSPVEFSITADITSFEDIVLNLSVAGGTATAGTDFETTTFEYFDGTAWQPADNGTEVTIPAGQTSLLIRIDSTADGLVEVGETFTLAATVLSGSVNDSSDAGTGTILNDDVPAASVDDVTVDEDNGTITFTVTLDQAPITPATVVFSTSSGTTTSGVDFAATSGTLTFNPGETSKSVNVTISDDNLLEQSETLLLNLSAGVDVSVADGQGVGTIIDDGSGPNGTDDDRPVLSVNSISATEDVDSHAVFTVNLSNASTQATTVNLTLSGVTATGGGVDFGSGLEYLDGITWQALAGDLSIPAQTTSVLVRTAIVDDAVTDDGETFTLTAVTVTGVTLNASDTGVATINDDPTPDVTTVSIAGPGSVTEGDTAQFTVSISNTPLTDVTVTFSYSGTAAGGTDYAGLASVTIPAGGTSAMFSIAAIDDTLGEPLENVIITIDNITGGSLEATAIHATNNAVTTNIVDDDEPVVSVNDVVVVEGLVSHIEFSVELSNPTYEDITLNLTATPVTASGDGVDYGIVGSDELEVFDGTTWHPVSAATITAGATSLRLRTPVIDDVAGGEADETFLVTAAVSAGNADDNTAQGIGTIQDDTLHKELVLVSITGPTSVVEGSTTTDYTVVLTNDATNMPVSAFEDVTVTLTYSGTASDGVDFSGVATVTIPLGSESATFALPVIDDALYEGNEDVIITIDAVTGGGFEDVGIDPAAATITMMITDVADEPTVSVYDVTAVEGTDEFAIFTVEISNLSVEDIDIDLALTAGTASGGGTDFDTATGGLEVFDGTNWQPATSATIVAGEMYVQVRVPIVDDATDEPDESYTLIANVTAGTTTTLQAVGTGTIVDNDAAPDVNIADASAGEGDALVFNVTLSNPSSQPIILNIAALDLSADNTDYAATTLDFSTDGGGTWLPAVDGTKVTIPADSIAIQVRISTTEDTTLETTETLQLAIGAIEIGTAGNTSNTAVGTITDDDTALVSITASAGVAGEPASNGQFQISMTAPSDSPTTISYSNSGSGINGTDFATLSGSITLPAGSTNGNIDLTIIDDTIVEGAEDVTLTLTAVTSGDAHITIDGAANTASATIADDDAATWQLRGDAFVNEGASAAYRLNLQGTLQSGEVVSIDVSLTDNSTNAADHASLASALATAVGNYSGPGTVTLSGTTVTFKSDGAGAMQQLVINVAAAPENITEGPEAFEIEISNASSATDAVVSIDAAAQIVTTTINDTIDAVGTAADTAHWSVSAPSSVDEGSLASITVALDVPLGLHEIASVDIAFSDISTNIADYDLVLDAIQAAADSNVNVTFDGVATLTYTAPSDGATIADLVIILAVSNDNFIEGVEEFRVDLSNPASTTGAAIAVDSTAANVVVSINDTATPGGSVEGPGAWQIIGTTDVDEGNTADYTLSLSGQFGENETSTIDLSLTDNTASATDHAAFTAAVAAASALRTDITFDEGSGRLQFTASTDGATMTPLLIGLVTANDAFIEGPENFIVTIAHAQSSTGANVSVSTSQNTVTTDIQDTQSPGDPTKDGPAEWSIAGDTNQDEGGTATYTISLSGQFGALESSTVEVNFDDVSTNAVDHGTIVDALIAAASANPDVTFDSGNSTLTFTAPADGTSMTNLVIDLAINDDTLIEGPESLKFELANASSATDAFVGISLTQHSVTTVINDTQGIGGTADGPALWSIHGQTWGDEGGTYPWTIRLAGEVSEGQSASVVVDLTDISTNANDYADIHSAIELAVDADPTLTYDDATSTLTFTSPGDGATMTDLTFDLLIVNDDWTEGAETFAIGLTSPGSTMGLTSVAVDSANATVTTQILDTQGEGQVSELAAKWSITGDTSVDEGGVAAYIIKLSGTFGVDENAKVQLTLFNVDTNSSDYAVFADSVQASIVASGDSTLGFDSGTGLLTFTSPVDGGEMADLTLSLPITDDVFAEGPERYTISLSNGESTTDAAVTIDTLTDTVATVIVDTNGDGGTADGPALWNLTAASTSVDEGANAVYTLSLSESFGADESVSVELDLIDVSTNSTDYGALRDAIQTAADANAHVTFDGTNTLTYTAANDGDVMSSLIITLLAQDDALIEGPEFFLLTLSSAATATGVAVGIDSASVTTTILDTMGLGGDADRADWSITGSASIDEGGTASYSIELENILQADETATIEVSLSHLETSDDDISDVIAAIAAAVDARSDLELNSGVLSFTSTGVAMSALTFSLNATDDSFIEGSERLQLVLANAGSSTGAAVGLDSSNGDVVTTIRDTVGDGGSTENAQWTLGVNQTVREGAAGAYLLQQNGNLQNGEIVSVDLTLDNLQTSVDDYANFSDAMDVAAMAYNSSISPGTVAWDGSTFTFTSDGTGPMAALPISLTATDDLIAEGVEDFVISLTNATSSTGAATSITATNDGAVTTIDDTAGAGADDVTFSIVGSSVVNEGAFASYTISLAGIAAASETAFVDLTLTNISTNSQDYATFITAVESAVSVRTDLEFSAGTLTFTSSGAAMGDLAISFNATDDVLLEGPEAFSISLANAGSSTGIVVGVDSMANVALTTINDTNGAGGVEESGGEWMVIGTASIAEGNDASYTIQLHGNLQSSEATSVELTLANMEASSADYETFATAVSDAVDAYNADSGNPGTLSWDGMSLEFVSSGAGPMKDLNIILSTTSDVLVEGPERFRVNIQNATSTTGLSPTVSTTRGTITTTIVDDESVTWSLSGPTDINEGNTGSITLSLQGIAQTAEKLSVVLSLADIHTTGSDYAVFTDALTAAAALRSDIDFDSNTQTVTFTGTGVAMADFVFDVSPSDDTLIEGPEDFRVELSSPTSSTAAAVELDPAASQVTTTINDQTSAALWSIAGSTAVDEGADAEYTISLTGTFGGGEQTSVQIDLSHVTTNSDDYDAILSAIAAAAAANTQVVFDGVNQLTYTAPTEGASMQNLTFTLPITNDSLIEGRENFRIDLSNPTSATAAPVGLDNNYITTNINDVQTPGGAADGPGEWNLSGTTTANEGANAVYTLSLSGSYGAGEVVTVDVQLEDLSSNNSDYGNVISALQAAADANPHVVFDGSSRFTYTAPDDGATMSPLQISLAVTNDAYIEGVESFRLQIANALSSTGAHVGLSNTMITTEIVDTQLANGGTDGPAEWNIVGSASVDEGAIDEGAIATYTISLSGQFGEDESVSVKLNLNDVTTGSDDYDEILTAIATAADTNADVVFDGVDTLTYSAPSDGASMDDLVVTLPITDDTLIEGVENFRLELTDATSTTGAAVDINTASANTVINDTQGASGNSDGPAEWSISTAANVDEGQTASFVISVSGHFGAGETATVRITPNALDTNLDDYANIVAAIQAAAMAHPNVVFDSTNQTLTYTAPTDGASMTPLTVDVSIIDDVLVEGPENFALQLSNPASGTGAHVSINPTASAATTTINDTRGAEGSIDGPAVWSLSGDVNVDEGRSAAYTLSLTETLQADEIVSVKLVVVDNSTDGGDYHTFSAAVSLAISGRPELDFDAATGTLTFTSDGLPLQDVVISLPTTDDTIIEGTESFSIQISDVATSTNAPVAIDANSDTVTTTINDNESAIWAINGPSAADEGSTPQFTISLAGTLQVDEEISIDLNLIDSSTNAGDYLDFATAVNSAVSGRSELSFDSISGTLTFIGTGNPLADVVIDLTLQDDNFIERDEQFTLTISNPGSSTGAAVFVDPSAANAVTTINDTQGQGGTNDGPAIWSIIGPDEVAEGTSPEYTIRLSGTFQAGAGVSVEISLIDNSSNAEDHGSLFAQIAAAVLNDPDLTFDEVTGTLTFTAEADGASMTPLVVTLPITDDAVVELPEDYTISLNNPATTTGVPTTIGGAAMPPLSAPVAVVDLVQTTESAAISFNPTTNDFYDHGDPLTVVGFDAVSHGLVTQNGNVLTFTPNAGFTGQDTFLYTVSDGGGNTSTSAVVVTVLPAGGAAVERPFGQHVDYADGTILPNHRTTAQLDDDVREFYDTWKSRYVVSAGTVGGQPMYRVAFSFGSDETVSEGQGYGMMITALMAGHDPEAQDLFDGLLRFSQENPSDGDSRLSDWQVPANVDGNGSAFDGDADIAYALLLADAQWGSDGAIDYAAEAETTITAIYESTIGPDSHLPELGDWIQADHVTHNEWVSRSSDHMPSHFRAFGAATNNTAAWDEVIAASQAVINSLQANHAPLTGLLPDFIVNADTSPAPAPSGFEEGPHDGSYFYNAGRDPLRLGLDGLLNGDATSIAQVLKISHWAEAVTGGDPQNLQAGYDLDGNPLPGSNYFTTFFAAPLGVAAMNDPGQQDWLNAIYDSTYSVTEDYYEDSVNLLSLITMSGNYWDPTAETDNVTHPADISAGSVTTTINGDPHVQDDLHRTAVGTPVSGNVLDNDTDPDSDPLTVTPTPITAPENGTLVLLSNGNFIYTPDADFRGVDRFEYEVCDDWGNCETAVVTIMLADLSSTKEQVLLAPNGDHFDVTFTVRIANTGTTQIHDLSVEDDLRGQFGDAFVAVSDVTLDSSGILNGTIPTVNSSWSTNTSLDLLDATVTNEFLLPGEWFSLTYTVTVDPDAGGTSSALGNQAVVTGQDISTVPGNALQVTDASDSGRDPFSTNADAAGDTGGEDDITPLHISDLGVAKQQVGTPTQLADGSWNVAFELFVENTGTVDLGAPSLFDDVANQFSTAWHGTSELALDASGVSLGGTAPNLNNGWQTNPSADILDGTGILKPGEFVRVTFTVNVDPDDLPSGLSRSLTTQATGSGAALDNNGNPILDPAGLAIRTTDLSDAGSDPNGTNPNQPGDSGTSDDATPLVLPEIGIAKRIIGSVPAATAGNFNVTYEAVIRNTGSVDLGQLTLVENLQGQIGNGFVGLVGPPVIYASTATTDPQFNDQWDGNLNFVGDANMFDNVSGVLQPGEQVVIQFTVVIDIDQITPASSNQILAGASYDETPGHAGFEGLVSDLSDSGSDPAGNNPGQTGDSTSSDDPTLIPAIGLAKQHGTAISAGVNGEEFSVPITLRLQNLGRVELGDLNLVDDVRTQFGGAFVSVDSLSIDTTGVVVGTTPGLSVNWAGDGANIFDGSGSLGSGDVVVVTFNVVIDPDAGGTSSALTNSAVISATDANTPGLTIQDVSDSGISPSTTNPGDPGDQLTADDVTPILIGDAGLAKQVTDIALSGIGFDLTVVFTLENTGTATLTDLQLHDDLMEQFGEHFGYVASAPAVIAGNAATLPGMNPDYIDDTSQNIFDGTGELEAGESVTVQLVAHVTPTASGTVEIVNQATGGGTAVNPDGTPIDGLAAIIDVSDSGSDPNGTNPGAPGDTGGTADSTLTNLQFYSYDSLNDFSKGFGRAPTETTEFGHLLLSKQNSTLAPEPIFSGSARPGTRIIGRIFDSSGQLIAEELSFADMGGNWSMVMHNVQNGDHHRIEFVEVVGQGNTFGSYGDIYGYLGLDSHFNHYASLEPMTHFGEKYSLGSVFQNSAQQALIADHQVNNNPIGFGL